MPIRVPCTTRRVRFAATVVALTLCVGGGTAAASSPANRLGSPAAARLGPGSIPGATPFSVPGVTSIGLPGMNLIGAPVHAVFLGDSYTEGIGATQHSDGYAYLVAEALGWSADIIGLPGSGYTRVAENTGLSIAAGIQPAIAAHPQVLIVECGHNDTGRGMSVARTKRNALRDLRELRASLPYTTIVVLGPIWLSGRPSARALAVRNAIHAVQKTIPGSLWIDPIAQKWFTGEWATRSGDDATMINYQAGHPNNLGYQHIAQLLEADLEELGIASLDPGAGPARDGLGRAASGRP